MALGPDMIDGLRRQPAVQTTSTCEVMEGMPPSASMGFGTEILKENAIPGHHALTTAAGKFAPAVSSGNVSLIAVFPFAHAPGQGS